MRQIHRVCTFLSFIQYMHCTFLSFIKYMHWLKIYYVKKCCKFVKNCFFGIKHLHAHLQYVCNTSAKHLKDTLKALGVDFINYTLSISTMENIVKLKLQSGITLATLTLQPINSYNTCIV